MLQSNDRQRMMVCYPSVQMDVNSLQRYKTRHIIWLIQYESYYIFHTEDSLFSAEFLSARTKFSFDRLTLVKIVWFSHLLNRNDFWASLSKHRFQWLAVGQKQLVLDMHHIAATNPHTLLPSACWSFWKRIKLALLFFASKMFRWYYTVPIFDRIRLQLAA